MSFRLLWVIVFVFVGGCKTETPRVTRPPVTEKPPIETPLPTKPPEREPEEPAEPEPKPTPAEPPPKPTPAPAPQEPDSARSSVTLGAGNPRYPVPGYPLFAPAFFADGNDKQHIRVVVLDAAEKPVEGADVRGRSLRPPLIAANGFAIESDVKVVFDGKTNGDGVVEGYVTTRMSGHAYTRQDWPFEFSITIDAKRPDGTWLTLRNIDGFKAETIVSTDEGAGKVYVLPAEAPPGVTRIVTIRAISGVAAPGGADKPVVGAYVEFVRKLTNKPPSNLVPVSGPTGWLTNAKGEATLRFTPSSELAGTNEAYIAYVDGRPLNIMASVPIST